MVSLDVVSLFTNVPLDFTIEIILDKLFKDEMVKTKLNRSELKELLGLCTKKMHFSFDNQIYKQTNGVALGSPFVRSSASKHFYGIPRGKDDSRASH